MIIPAPPLTSTERVQSFRARNPGYDRRWKARRGQGRGSTARTRARLAEFYAQAAAAQSAGPQSAPAAPAVVVPAVKPMLMLPAPVEDPTMAELSALAASLKARPARDPQLAPHPARREAA